MQIKHVGMAFVAGGLFITFGAVGGIETQPEQSLLAQCLAAVAGLFLMYVGTRLIGE